MLGTYFRDSFPIRYIFPSITLYYFLSISVSGSKSERLISSRCHRHCHNFKLIAGSRIVPLEFNSIITSSHSSQKNKFLGIFFNPIHSRWNPLEHRSHSNKLASWDGLEQTSHTMLFISYSKVLTFAIPVSSKNFLVASLHKVSHSEFQSLLMCSKCNFGKNLTILMHFECSYISSRL